MKNPQFFLVSGYGWSGSSAVVDLLKEYDCNIEPGIEFRLIKDPYGINDLHNSLIVKRDPLNYDIALKDFLWFIEMLNRKPSKFKFGLNYETYFGNNFATLSEEFVSKLINYKYESFWWMFDIKKHWADVLLEKLRRKFLKHKTQPTYMYFSNISDEKFCQLANEYIEKLFARHLNDKVSNIILDQAISILNATNEMRFFKNRKLIIVDRDPRDIYTDLCLGGFLIGDELLQKRDARMYVDWHKAWRVNDVKLDNCSDILRLNFEDVILNYDETLEKIESFLGLESRHHINSMKFLDINRSKNNIGIWKNFMNKEELSIFDKYLSMYYFVS